VAGIWPYKLGVINQIGGTRKAGAAILVVGSFAPSSADEALAPLGGAWAIEGRGAAGRVIGGNTGYIEIKQWGSSTECDIENQFE